MQSFRSLFALLVLAWPYFLTAQEVKYIDISNVRLRTELRHPPPSPAECKAGACIGGGSGGVSSEMVRRPTRSARAWSLFVKCTSDGNPTG
jgi:hypothetical protein